jgi:ProP effector
MSTVADKKRKYSEALATIALLAEKYPRAVFMLEARRRPLKIGIDTDLIAQLDGALKPNELHNALRVYTSAAGYLARMHSGAVRIDLNGEAAGTVTVEAARKAAEQLANKLLKVAARREERRKAHMAAEYPAGSGSAGGTVSVRPRKLSLSDLKASAMARKAAVS